jgi:hypothetical protein
MVPDGCSFPAMFDPFVLADDSRGHGPAHAGLASWHLIHLARAHAWHFDGLVTGIGPG